MVNEAGMSIEAVSLSLRGLLLRFVVACGLWQATNIIGDFTNNGRHLGWLVGLMFVGVHLLSALAWAIYYVRLLLLCRKLRGRPALLAALGDERFLQTRLKAAMVALACIVGCQMAIILASFAWPLSAKEGADITILVAFNSFLGSFLWMERG